MPKDKVKGMKGKKGSFVLYDGFETLDRRTLEYWKLSRIWEGRDIPCTTEYALRTSAHILTTTNPASKLGQLMSRLEAEIIAGGRKKVNKDKSTGKLIQFPSISNVSVHTPSSESKDSADDHNSQQPQPQPQPQQHAAQGHA